MKFSDPIKISKQIISLPILESLFSVNRGILDLIGDVATFCLDIQAKLVLHAIKPLYSANLRFLKKVSTTTRCRLYRVFNFFEEKRIINKNLTISYVKSVL